MIIGTAGHIDHGKTTLVKALTGVDADRLPEEKARGISLDLGYAYTSLADGTRLGFVDVPGHERLVHNMLAGATGIDFLLLVVAADDGPMPQTREHLTIAGLLGIRRAAVALTKIDAVEASRQSEAEVEISALLAESGYADTPVFPVSGRSGFGVEALRDHLHAAAGEVATDARRRAARGGFRLAIDRCFSLSGAGTVVTGTAFAGHVRAGETLVLTPPGIPVRVRSLRVQDQPAPAGGYGQRIALALTGDFERNQIQRGHWLTHPALHHPVTRLCAQLQVPPGGKPLRHWTPVHLHLGAEDVLARVQVLEGELIEPGEARLVELVLDRPIGALIADRFVLRDQSARHTLAGGRVLDIAPPQRHRRSPARLDVLRAGASGNPQSALAAALAHSGDGVDLDAFARAWNLPAEDATALWAQHTLQIVPEGERRLGFARDAWRALNDRLLDALAAEHERAPDMLGVEPERLRRMTRPSLSRAGFLALLDGLLATGHALRSGNWIHLPGHTATLSAADTAAWAALRPRLEENPYGPPRVRDIARATGEDEVRVRLLLKRVARLGWAYPVAHDHYFTAPAVSQLAEMVATLCEQEGEARAAALRNHIGGGRKVAIHILEFFDRIGYTRRVRDSHVLRGESSRTMSFL